jgi:hypothetical protein
MADQANFVIPKPPDNPNLEEIHTWAKDLFNFLQLNWSTGIQAPFFSQNQIDQMTTKDQAGKLFFNNDTGKFMGGEVAAGNLDVKTFTTS